MGAGMIEYGVGRCAVGKGGVIGLPQTKDVALKELAEPEKDEGEKNGRKPRR
jgi:hypothetical protein